MGNPLKISKENWRSNSCSGAFAPFSRIWKISKENWRRQPFNDLWSRWSPWRSQRRIEGVQHAHSTLPDPLCEKISKENWRIEAISLILCLILATRRSQRRIEGWRLPYPIPNNPKPVWRSQRRIEGTITALRRNPWSWIWRSQRRIEGLEFALALCASASLGKISKENWRGHCPWTPQLPNACLRRSQRRIEGRVVD